MRIRDSLVIQKCYKVTNTFPTYRQLQDFLKQRLFPEFDDGYYKSLIKNPKEMTQNMMKIRDSSLVFRTSSQGSSMEGLICSSL